MSDYIVTGMCLLPFKEEIEDGYESDVQKTKAHHSIIDNPETKAGSRQKG